MTDKSFAIGAAGSFVDFCFYVVRLLGLSMRCNLPVALVARFCAVTSEMILYGSLF